MCGAGWSSGPFPVRFGCDGQCLIGCVSAMESKPQIQLAITSNPLFLSGTREFVYHIASRVGFSEEACGQMALAVDEAICNVIRHGYDRALDKPIWISLQCIGGVAAPETQQTNPTTALQIVIEDEARQVDLSMIKSRNLDEIRPGGLGVHIIQEVMDDVKYEHRSGKGMRLTMVKLRNSAKRAGSGDVDSPGLEGDPTSSSSVSPSPTVKQEMHP